MYLNWPVRRAEVRRKLATSVLFCSLLSLLWRKFYTQVFFWLSFFLICFVLRIKEQEFLTKRKNHQLNQGRKKQCKHSWKWTINSFSNPESNHNNKNLNKVHFVQNNKVSLPFYLLLQQLLVQDEQERFGDKDRSLWMLLSLYSMNINFLDYWMIKFEE